VYVTTRFTIAIPTHDRCETVVLAARSALAQTRPPEQVLVLCDGCTDGTTEVLRDLGSSRLEALDWSKAPGYGYEHRNRSLELARGEVILWLADDDLLTPDHLERLGELWDTGRFDLVQSDGVVVHPDDEVECFGADWSVPLSRARLASSNTNPMSSVSVRVDLARAIGGWDVELQRAADWNLWQRALAAGARTARSPELTVLHFRARDRNQAWPLRVRQNAAWLERLEDPQRLLELRISVRRAEAERQANTENCAVGLEQRRATLQRDLHALEDELNAVRDELGNASRHAETLARIYNGGWWRLRSRVRPLLRLLGRDS
jgi:glycosyltransferase involved in cell wall biosynthesis